MWIPSYKNRKPGFIQPSRPWLFGNVFKNFKLSQNLIDSRLYIAKPLTHSFLFGPLLCWSSPKLWPAGVRNEANTEVAITQFLQWPHEAGSRSHSIPIKFHTSVSNFAKLTSPFITTVDDVTEGPSIFIYKNNHHSFHSFFYAFDQIK